MTINLANLSDHEQMLHRIGFLEGVIEGIRLYVISRNSEQKAGCMERPLYEILKPFEEELASILAQIPS